MRLNDITKHATWMDPDESRWAKRFVRDIGNLVEQAGVAETPLLVLRVHEVMVASLLARRVERTLEIRTDEVDAPVPPDAKDCDLVWKVHDRLRKAVRELEDFCSRAGTPIDQGLPERVLPLLQKTDGVLESILKEVDHAP